MKRQTFSDINITPLTDIFLVLLIIMMVVAPMLDQQGLNLAVPNYVDAQQIEKESQILTIQVDENNKYFLDGEEIQASDLEQVIKDNIENFPDGLMIEAEGNSNHGSVVKLMDSARNAGMFNISITEI